MDRNTVVLAETVAHLVTQGIGRVLESPNMVEHMTLAINAAASIEEIGGAPPGQGRAHGPGNRFKPHQGAREQARRRRQMQK